MELELKTYRLKLKHRFRISREAYDEQETFICCLSASGKTGYGEATANPYYGMTVESMIAEIEAIRELIESHEFKDPETFYQLIDNAKLRSFTRCALDLAAHDLYGKILDKPLYEIWGTSATHYPITNYTIGLDTVDNMIVKMEEKPWPIYKIKLGTDDDLGIIRQLREHSQSIFRIDANCAWTAEETIANAEILKELGVEFIEQPLPADDWKGMEQVLHNR